MSVSFIHGVVGWYVVSKIGNSVIVNTLFVVAPIFCESFTFGCCFML